MKSRTLLVVVLFFLGLTQDVFAQNNGPRVISSGSEVLCPNTKITLSIINLPNNNYSYQWIKDGANIRDSTRSTLEVTQAGTYTVEITRIGNNNGDPTVLNNIVVRAGTAPTTDFGFNPISSCGLSTITFSNGTTGAEKYEWDFGDGKTSTATNPSHNFIPSKGVGVDSFRVTLTATSTTGCISRATRTIGIERRPDATLFGPNPSTLNGSFYFRNCTPIDVPFEFTNGSTTKPINTRYLIRWYDNTPNFDSNTFDASIPRTYGQGLSKLTFIVYKGESCLDSTEYFIYRGSTPDALFGAIGTVPICTGEATSFYIDRFSANPPGTSYVIRYSDSSAADSFMHPPPLSYTHVFNKSSCGFTAGTLTNSFEAKIVTSNPCGTRQGTTSPIYVSDKPRADFSIITGDSICEGQLVSIKNMVPIQNSVGDDGQCTAGKFYWKVESTTPGASWSLVTGSLGTTNGANDPFNWTAGSIDLNLSFLTKGEYKLTLIVKNNNFCQSDTMIKIICVNPSPTADFTTDVTEGCGPLKVKATGTTNQAFCGNNLFVWSINYQPLNECSPQFLQYNLLNGTTLNSPSPEFELLNPGTYTINLQVFAPGGKCVSGLIQKVITVKGVPVVTIPAIPDFCQDKSIAPTMTATCFIDSLTTYSWTFPDGSPSNSSSKIPGNVFFTTPGTKTITASATNVCGTGTVNLNINVLALPTVAVIDGPDQVCVGSTIQLTNATTGGTWASLQPTIATVDANGNVIGLSEGTAEITYTVTSAGCSRVVTKTITVNPNPILTVPGRQDICIGNSVDLTISGNASTYSWSPATGLNTTSGTNVTASPTTTQKYIITATNSTTGCVTKDSITVNVNQQPNLLVNSPTICAGGSANLTATGAVTYTWSPSTGLLTTTGAQVVATPTQTQIYTVIGTSGVGCTDTAQATVTVNPRPVVSVNSGSICAGSSITLTAQGADSYTWAVPGGSVLTGSSVSVSPLVTSTIRVTGSNQTTNCSNVADALVTVNPLPNVTVNSPTICPGDSAILIAAGADIFSWTPSTDLNTNIGSTVISKPTGNITYTVRGTNNQTTCFREVDAVVTVRAIPSIQVESTNPTTCNGTTGAIRITGLVPNTSYTAFYTLLNTERSFAGSSNASGVLTITGLASGTYSNIYISQFSCVSNAIASITLTDPQPPVQPIISEVNPICSGNDLTLSISNGITNGSYIWTGPNGFNQSTTLTSVVLPNVQVASAGVYNVIAVQNACSSTNASVSVVVNPTPLAPTVANLTFCQLDQTRELVAGIVPTNQALWYTVAQGGTSSTQAPTPSTSQTGSTTYYVSQKSPEGCESPRAPLTVLVNTTPNIGAQTVELCTDVPLSFIPTNAPANTLYTWSLPNIAIPGSITGATAQSTPVASINQLLTNTTLAAASAIYTIANATGSCKGPDFELTVNLNPTPLILDKVLDPICSGETFTFTPAQGILGERLPTGTRLSWTIASISPANAVTGAGASVAPQTSLIQTLVNQTNQVATVTYTVTPYLNDCAGKPFSVSIQVNPRPLLPNLNETICSEQTVNPIFQNSPPSRILPQGTLFTWALPQVVGNNPNAISGFTAQASGVSSFIQTLVNNTSSPQRLIYTVSSIAGTCAGPDFTIEVLVNPKPNLTSFSDTICSGTSFVLPTNAAPVGTTYTWGLPVVIGAGNVSGIAAQTTPVTTVSQRLSSDQILPVKVLYNIVPATGNCGGSGFPLEVIVNPTPFLPTLRDTICTALSFDVIPSNGISGSIVPAGTTYTWDLPTSVIPGLVTGGAAQQVQQPNISQQLFNSSDAPVGMIYKVTPRSGSFGNCVGPLFDIIVTVNPDARAVISPIDTIGCAPFVIDNNRVRLQQRPSANADYNWFIDGSLIGSGLVFPGFTMRSPDDTILLKLLTTSLHGCKPDSAFRRFYTYKVPSPSFAVSDTVGCGPLNVVITNNTPFKELFTYRWSFGNGITSFQADPPPVTYLPNPSFGDTIYIMKLDVNSICGTYSTETRIRVKSRPKALFTPSSTVGCSPMKVTFNNTSRGLNNRYVWNFGDGRIDSTTTLGLFEHTFITAVRDTFTVKLYAINECGIDSSSYDIIVSPNTIKLDYAVNGTQKEGCVTHRVDFINNTIGASLFRWDFGDGNVRSTTKNIDTVSHTYLQPGIYNVKLFATNGCSDTTATEQIIVYGLPTAEFLLSRTTACIGDSIFMLNRSQGADTYLWKFGDGRTSTAVNPGHRFSQSGDKEITLIAYKSNAPGIVCVDSVVRTVSITDSVNINFNYSDSIANCAPLTVTFKNLYPGNTFAAWDFGDGRRQNGDSVSNTYTIPGNYLVTLNVKAINGCNYYGSKPIVIRSPFGIVRYKSNFSCIDETLRFEALPENTDSIRWNFGDGTTFTTTERVVFYKYKLPGTYLPKVEFVSSAGCSYLPPIRDSIRIDRVNAGFKSVREEICGSTKVIFTDTSTTYFPRSTIRWNFGDGTVGNNAIQEINYRSSNTFIITNIVTSVSGCSDTAVTVLPVFVKGIPSVQVIGDTAGCTNRSVRLESKILSSDSISLIRWRTAQNTDIYGSIFTAQYGVSGSYPMTLIVGTKFGCYDTVSVPLTVYTAPNVVASADVTICSGSSIELNATGADRYSWFPIQDISCVNCQKTIAKPQQSTIFSVRGESINGCFDLDTVLVTVIPKFKMKATPSDSICIGDSIQLVVSGAASYKWTPSSTLSGDTIQNPIAKPERTTTYRIVGSDEYGCFKDTAFITIGVGNYPTLNLGEDLLLATGALFTVKPTFTEGPMKSWKWTPAKDLNCVDCPNPTIRARNGITYVAQATNFFGCSATDSITVRVFCENSQVFIPNAFTPDNDGINDLFIVRASGIQSVKSLKIFNRWGQMVFDRANFEPNDPKNAWDGRVNGIVGGPDVYVYIVEVICDDGTPYFYKGNVSILK